MATQEYKRIRVEGDVRLAFVTPVNLLAPTTAPSVVFGRGESIQVEYSTLEKDATLLEKTNLATLTCEVKDLLRGRDAPDETVEPLMRKVLAVGDLAAVTYANWSATDSIVQQALFQFSDAETQNCSAGSKWFCIYGTTVAGNTITYRAGTITVAEDGIPSGAAPVPAITGGYTTEVADARFLANSRRYISSYHGGVTVDEATWGYIYIEESGEIEAVQAVAADGPSGEAFSIDLVNAADVVQSAGITPIADGATYGRAVLAAPLAVNIGDILRIKNKTGECVDLGLHLILKPTRA